MCGLLLCCLIGYIEGEVVFVMQLVDGKCMLCLEVWDIFLLCGFFGCVVVIMMCSVVLVG